MEGQSLLVPFRRLEKGLAVRAKPPAAVTKETDMYTIKKHVAREGARSGTHPTPTHQQPRTTDVQHNSRYQHESDRHTDLDVRHAKDAGLATAQNRNEASRYRLSVPFLFHTSVSGSQF